MGRWRHDTQAARLQLRRLPAADGDDVRFDYRIVEPGAGPMVQSYELSMANAMQILRLLGGSGASPRFVAFMHRQQGPDEAYARTFGCPVRFSADCCGFVLPPALAERALDRADPQTMAVAAAYLESRHPPGTASLPVRVAELIRRLLPTGQCSIEAVAEQLALHARTLQRRLADEDSRYEALLDDGRRELAAHYLGETGLHLSQVTGLLGYAEQSALNRSCRRWFGMTPRQYRLHSKR